MSRNNILRSFPLIAAGGTITIESNSGVSLLKLTGTATLVGAYNVVTSGVFSQGDLIKTFYDGTLDFNGNNFTILGKLIPDYLEAKQFIMFSIYDGSAWDSYIVVDPSLADVIDGESIVVNTFDGVSILDTTIEQDKMESLDEGSILVGNVSGVPTPLDAKLSAKLLIGNGTTVASVSMSGHATINASGVITIANGVITPAMLSFGVGGELRAVEVTLTNAQILALNSSPITILANSSVGAGNIVDVVRVALIYDYSTTPYAYSGDLQVEYTDGKDIVAITETDLEVSVDKSWVVPTSQYDMIPEIGVRIIALSGNPTGGNAASSLKVRIYYTLMATS